MMFLFDLLSLELLLTIVDSQSLCFWNRSNTGFSGNALNGEYTFAGTNNGHNYYTMNVDPSCAYGSNQVTTFYFYQLSYTGEWAIGGSLDSDTLFAYCDTGTGSNTDPTTPCNDKWQINGVTDTAITVTSGPCPVWDCDVITTSFEDPISANTPCGVDFDVKEGTNQWSGYETGWNEEVYFYFHPRYFTWVCNAQIYLGCAMTSWKNSNPGWMDISEGESTVITFDSSSITVNCVDSDAYATTFTPSVDTEVPIDSTVSSPIGSSTAPTTSTASSTGSSDLDEDDIETTAHSVGDDEDDNEGNNGRNGVNQGYCCIGVMIPILCVVFVIA